MLARSSNVAALAFPWMGGGDRGCSGKNAAHLINVGLKPLLARV